MIYPFEFRILPIFLAFPYLRIYEYYSKHKTELGNNQKISVCMKSLNLDD
jgi:hypothetical protein